MSDGRWYRVEGEEPGDWSDTDFAWVRWDDGQIELVETFGHFGWKDMTHYSPAHMEPPAFADDNE